MTVAVTVALTLGPIRAVLGRGIRAVKYDGEEDCLVSYRYRNPLFFQVLRKSSDGGRYCGSERRAGERVGR